MSERSSSSTTGGLGFLAALMLVALILLVATVVIDAAKSMQFDGKVDSGKIAIAGNSIDLGRQGNPATVTLPEYVPDGSDLLARHPRLYEVAGCMSITLDKDVKHVLAASAYFDPTQITISVPLQTSGSVNICVPEGTTIQVVIWATE